MVTATKRGRFGSFWWWICKEKQKNKETEFNQTVEMCGNEELLQKSTKVSFHKSIKLNTIFLFLKNFFSKSISIQKIYKVFILAQQFLPLNIFKYIANSCIQIQNSNFIYSSKWCAHAHRHVFFALNWNFSINFFYETIDIKCWQDEKLSHTYEFNSNTWKSHTHARSYTLCHSMLVYIHA